MPAWLSLAMLVAIFFGVVPILSNKAIQIHGPIVNFLILNEVMFVLALTWLLFSGYQNIFLVTKKSLSFSLIGGVLSFFGVALIYSIYEMFPRELSLIAITTSFSVVILAIINNFLGEKLFFHQWLGAIIAFLGIVLVNWKK
ncbi:MAG: EamA family transporter [Candidatus Yanofskybacteria bacterium]|nr:EamA family transporter [Candidatus Yanofskybacteria bacterium]